MKRILVTGAQGFVGRYLVAELLEREPDAKVVGVGRSAPVPTGFSNGLPLPQALHRRIALHGDRYQYFPVAIDSLKALVRELQPDCVFHLASALHTAEPRELFRTNVEGTLELLNALSGHHALLVHGSSGSVYGEPKALPIREDHACAPTTLYGLSKSAAEQALSIRAHRHIVARMFNIIGPGQTAEHVCGRFARDLLSLNGTEKLLRVGPLAATRDFIDVRDVATALCSLASAGEAGQAYNVASGVEVSIREMLRELVRVSGMDVRIEEGRPHATGVSRHVGDPSKLCRLGWAPAFTLEKSLSDLLDFQRDRAAPAPVLAAV